MRTGSPEGPAWLRNVQRVRRPLTLVPWRMRGKLFLLGAASVLSALLDLAGVLAMMPLMQLLTVPDSVPGVLQRFLVPVVGTDNRRTLLLATALFVGLMFILKNVTMVVLRWWSIGVTSRASAAAQATLLDKYVHASYASHRQRTKPKIIQAVTGAVDSYFAGVLLGVIGILTDLVTAAVLLISLLVLAPVASLVAAVVFCGAALFMVRVLKPYAIRLGLRGLELSTRMWSYLNPAIEGFRESRIFGREDFFVQQFRANRFESINPKRGNQVLGELPRYFMEIVMIFGILAVAILVFSTRPDGEAFGLLAVFAAASVRIAPALNRVVAAVNGLRSSAASLDMLLEEMTNLDSEDSTVTEATDDVQTIPDGDIDVADVSFRYPDASTDVLTDITVTIPRGRTIALVGSSGAGKTTFADLLLGLLVPTSGTISVSGIDVSRHPHAWRRSVAAVSQKVYLWDAPVRDLITFGQPADDVDHELLTQVTRQARLEDIIASLPHGLDTYVGEGGTRLSGGQAQRIGIARALYAQPHVLIMDEATSALDNETEHEITSTIDALHGQLTVIVIAHRLSTVRNADQILFFSQGRLADRGSMSSLRQTNAEFAHLVELGQLA